MAATIRSAVCVLAVASMAFAPYSTSADVPDVGSGDAAVSAIAHAFYYNVSFPRDPIGATSAGMHAYDGSIGAIDAAHTAKRLSQDDAFIAKVAAIDPATLSPEVAIDAKMFANALHDDELFFGELQQWRHDPDLYVNTASGGVYAVMERSYAPLAARAAFAIARERQIPALLQSARKNLTTVDATTARLAYDDAVGSEGFFTTSVPEAFAAVSDPALHARLAAADTVARNAMTSYAAWLKAGPLAHPSGTYAIGPKIYAERLKYEESLDIPLSQYRAIGQAALEKTHAAFVATAHEIDAHKSPEAVAASLGADHPTAATLLPTAQKDLIALRAFIISHHIVTLPSDANIRVIPTPVFQRATTFASMDAPGPLDTVATQAYYNVTPVDPAMPPQRQAQLLSFYNSSWLPLVSAHEVYPGHFVNYAIDKHLPLSLIRKLNWTASFGEGWAHYDEQMMVDEGWGDGNPKVRLAQLGGALLRECRYLVGLQEHTAGMSVDAGTRFFMTEAFMTRESAHKEALRGTQDPTYGYYTLGKLEILKLRADMKKKWGASYTLERFHDALLAHGDPPIPLLRPLLLGATDDGRVL